MNKFTVKDSGQRQEYASGMVRDLQDGKIDYLLALDGPMFKRYAEHLTKGAEKYGKRNWQLAKSDEEYQRFRSSALRHMVQWLAGDTDEDHAAAVQFNINAAEYVKERLAKPPEAPDLTRPVPIAVGTKVQVLPSVDLPLAEQRKAAQGIGEIVAINQNRKLDGEPYILVELPGRGLARTSRVWAEETQIATLHPEVFYERKQDAFLPLGADSLDYESPTPPLAEVSPEVGDIVTVHIHDKHREKPWYPDWHGQLGEVLAMETHVYNGPRVRLLTGPSAGRTGILDDFGRVSQWLPAVGDRVEVRASWSYLDGEVGTVEEIVSGKVAFNRPYNVRFESGERHALRLSELRPA